MAGGIKLAPLLTEIKVNIDGFKSEMEKAKVVGVTEAEKISKSLSGVTKVGDALQSTGAVMTAGITMPILGAGAAVTKMAVDYESSFAKVSTLLDDNVVDFDDYRKSLLDGSSESKTAVGEYSEAVYNAISAGVDQTKAVEFTNQAMKLAKGGFTDASKAVDVLTTAINAYGLEADDAGKVSDMLITTQNLGKTTVDELASSMGKVIPTANAYNVNLANVSAALADLTKNGIATAEATTYYNGMLNELGKSGTTADKTLRELAGKGFAELQAEGVPLTDCLKILKDEAEKSGKTLGDMFGSSEAAKAALVIMKDDGVEYNEILEQMESSAGTTQAAFEKIDATPTEQLNGALNKLKNAGIDLGVSLIPVVTKVADGIGKIADKFSGLSEEQQGNIIKWGGVLAAAGPVLGLLGGGIKTVTSVMSAVGGLSAALGGTGLVAGFGAATVAAAPLVLGVAAVGAAGYGVYKTLSEDVVPAVDLFEGKVTYATESVGESMYGMTQTTEASVVKISDATQEAVQSYMDMDDEVSRIMYDHKINQETVTYEIASSIIGKFQTMADTIKANEEISYQERLTSYGTYFGESSALTETEEQAILDNITKKHEEREGIVDGTMTRISEIYRLAKEEHRTLTEEEQIEINTLQEQMREDAINTFSETEAEAAVIKERMKDYQGRLSAEMASELVTKAIETKDGEIQAATEKCDEIIKQAARMLDAGDITEDQYDRIVLDAEGTRDATIKAAEDGYAGIIKNIEDNTPGIMTKINAQTGEIRSVWSDLMGTLRGWWDEITHANEEKTGNGPKTLPNYTTGNSSMPPSSRYNHYNGLDYVPYDGYTARLHEGEAVLTKSENREYKSAAADRKPSSMKATINIAGSKVETVVVPMVDDGVGTINAERWRLVT